MLLAVPLVVSLKIKCQYESVATFASVIGNHYKCYTRKVVIKNPYEVVDSIEGTHEDGKSSDDVKSISIFQATCHYFPKGLEKIFKNIQDIKVYHSGLRTISRDDLQPFRDLKALSLENNELTSLDSNLFEFNTKLKQIKLSGNYLTMIAAGVFDSLKDLEELSISYDDEHITRKAYNRDGVEGIKQEIALRFWSN